MEKRRRARGRRVIGAILITVGLMLLPFHPDVELITLPILSYFLGFFNALFILIFLGLLLLLIGTFMLGGMRNGRR